LTNFRLLLFPPLPWKKHFPRFRCVSPLARTIRMRACVAHMCVRAYTRSESGERGALRFIFAFFTAPISASAAAQRRPARYPHPFFAICFFPTPPVFRRIRVGHTVIHCGAESVEREQGDKSCVWGRIFYGIVPAPAAATTPSVAFHNFRCDFAVARRIRTRSCLALCCSRAFTRPESEQRPALRVVLVLFTSAPFRCPRSPADGRVICAHFSSFVSSLYPPFSNAPVVYTSSWIVARGPVRQGRRAL
jgi:hypothetical protein